MDNRTLNLTNVSITDGSVVQSSPETTFLWRESSYNLSVTMHTTGYTDPSYIDICTLGYPSGSENATGNVSCAVFSPNAEGSSTAHIQYSNASTGSQNVTVFVHDRQTNRTVARHNLSLTVITRDGDFDSDQLTNEREVSLGTNLAISDTDKDGLDDGAEVGNYGTDPLSTDTDGDGLPDGEEVNSGTNATNPDTDGDGLSDGREVNELSTIPTDPDTDGDGLGDAEEVRQYRTDPANPDSDDDGLSDGAEVNEYGTNPVRIDTDRDGFNDGSEVRLGTDPTSAWSPVGYILALGLLVVALVIALLWRYGNPLGGVLAGADRGSERAREEERERTTAELSASISDDEDAGEATDGEDATGVAGEPDATAPPVKTDEMRIMEMIADEGGRIYQRELVDRTDWSASKVSRLLSTMEEDGRIEKTRLGRENVVTIADSDTDDGDLEDVNVDGPDRSDDLSE